MTSSKSTAWTVDVDIKTTYPSLNKDLNTDVVIIGGGITGITAAYLLHKAGKKVVLVERGQIASGATAYTTAFITYVFDYYLQEIIQQFGEKEAKATWDSGKYAIDLIEKIILDENLDCEFRRCPAFIYTLDESKVDFLKKETELAQKFGFDVAFIEGKGNLGFNALGFMKVENQAKFHPRKYLTQLANKLQDAGVQIFEETEVLKVEGKDSVIVSTPEGKVTGDYAVIATHSPFTSPIKVQTKLIPYQSYVIEAKVPKGVLQEALFWDTDDPYHYLRIDTKDDYDSVILGGEDHVTGKDESHQDHYSALENYLKTLLPDLKYEIVRKWSGQILESIDGLPYIGKNPSEPHQILCTGYAGNGMTFGTIAGVLSRDIILGKENDWIDLYDPKRLANISQYMKLGIEGAKEFLKGRFGKKETFESILPDSGKVVSLDGKKVAVYKDPNGSIIKLSPVCPHLQCIVNWNDTEKTWDCPCHGSRFTKEGKVINGPANEDLTISKEQLTKSKEP